MEVSHQDNTKFTLDDLVSLTSGRDAWHTEAAGDIRALRMADGPHGLRVPDIGGDTIGIGTSVPATCFPPAVALGSTWDVGLARAVGAALGREARALGVDVLLGPGMNIKRSPLAGRNFEYFSEDPHLTGHMAAAVVEGVQSVGVAACIKHFAVNNQETDRMRVDARVDDRTLREIYLSAFEHVVRIARPWVVMSAYNRVNTVPASQHRWLLTDVLRDEWGFDGLVVSDWGAIEDRVAALEAGNDLEMPPSDTDVEVAAAVEVGRLSVPQLERVADRLRTLQRRILVARQRTPGPSDLTTVQADNAALARDVAAQAIVLLKNDGGVLPLDSPHTSRDSRRSVAIVGELARTPRFQGGGSSRVVPTRLRSSLQALREAYAADDLPFAEGYTLGGVADSGGLIEKAVHLAASTDLIVLFLGLPEGAESEGYDRVSLDLPTDQLALLDAVAAVARQLVVVLSNGGVVSVSPWRDKVDALLEGWLLGQEGGDAMADVLLGVRSPSGRLAETVPTCLQQVPNYLLFPGRDGVSVYGEGVFVGYRYFDTVEEAVAYPFGHGLTYSKFTYTDLRIVSGRPEDEWTVEFVITNVGTRAAAETAQLYVSLNNHRNTRPASELRGFAKVELEPGETRVVSLPLGPRDLSTWDSRNQRWSVEPGHYVVRVGASSRDIRLEASIESTGDGFHAPLTRDSTVNEWLSHPIGRTLLSEASVDIPGLLTDADAPETAELFGSMPLRTLRGFGFGVSEDAIARLVARAQAAGA